MDIYKKVTDCIIDQMEQKIIPWVTPWRSISAAVSRTTGKLYSLLVRCFRADRRFMEQRSRGWR